MLPTRLQLAWKTTGVAVMLACAALTLWWWNGHRTVLPQVPPRPRSLRPGSTGPEGTIRLEWVGLSGFGLTERYMGLRNLDDFSWTSVRVSIESPLGHTLDCITVSTVRPDAVAWFNPRECRSESGATYDPAVGSLRIMNVQATEGAVSVVFSPGLRISKQ